MRDDDADQLRRRFAVGAIAFLLAFVGLLVAAVVILVRFALPQEGWFETVVFFIQVIPFILAGALGIAWLAMYLFELPHYLLGHYHCHLCGRTQRSWGEICRCLPEAFRVRRKPRHWVHYRRRIQPVLTTYVGLLGIVLLHLAWQSRPRHYPFVLDVMIGHAALAALLGVLIHLATALLEVVNRGRRFRLRAMVYGRVLVAWPFCFFMAMALLTWLGVT